MSKQAREQGGKPRIAMQFGKEYFDGRANRVTAAIAMTAVGSHRGGHRQALCPEAGQRVLDVGCGKGFLVKDLMRVCPGLEAYGIDISEYAVANCEPEVAGRVRVGNATHLPFPDRSFDCVISINTIHNLEREACIQALREMERVAPGRGFVQVDAYRNPEERKVFENWMLTAKTYGRPEDWLQILCEAGYTGDYYWTILEVDPEWTITR
jgi:ubiquinone/menaquinone biosynthesis C-methylase UbiE